MAIVRNIGNDTATDNIAIIIADIRHRINVLNIDSPPIFSMIEFLLFAVTMYTRELLLLPNVIVGYLIPIYE
ncbi:hypothetical protein AGMMS50276_00500 [Synergistales bacterium]|nr:hypothetical protein AGMMS50276_00500 [Synergistales bacterium]